MEPIGPGPPTACDQATPAPKAGLRMAVLKTSFAVHNSVLAAPGVRASARNARLALAFRQSEPTFMPRLPARAA